MSTGPGIPTGMDAHALAKLEFEQVLALVAAHARTPLGRERALRLRPGQAGPVVRKWLDQTQAAGWSTRPALTGFISM